MRRLRIAFVAVVTIALTWVSRAEAQRQAQGFALERLYPSAPGGGWVVMDALDMHGGLGGAMALSSGYALKPLRVTDGSQHLAVVSDQALADFGFAVTYDRWRLYLNLDMMLATKGDSGTVGAYQYTGPSVDLGTNPDMVPDARIGLDVRLLGDAMSPFRLGAGAQLIVPSGKTIDYDTDGTYRAMGRILVAGNIGIFAYAGQLGVHVRPRDDWPTPGGPQGSEVLFGIAAGPRFPIPGPVPGGGRTVVIVGPEIYGETAFRSFLSKTGTGLEGLLTARIEGTADNGPQLRVKLGTGGGLNQSFGAPEWRIVFGVEVFDHTTDTDKDKDADGVTDGKDACLNVPGIKTDDPKTSGCPVDRDGDGIPDGEDSCPDVRGQKTMDPKTNGCPPSAEPLP